MIKRTISLFIVLAVFFQVSVYAKPYIEDKNEYLLNYESNIIDASKVAVNIDVNASGKPFVVTFEADVAAKVALTTDTANYTFFEYMSGRGPFVRSLSTTASQAQGPAVWLFNSDKTKPSWGSGKRTFKFVINPAKATVDTLVDGSITTYSSAEASYTEQPYTFAGTVLKSISFSGCKFSNFKVFYPPEEGKTTKYEDDEYGIHYKALSKLWIITSAFVSTNMTDTITKAQFATLAGRLMNIKESSYKGTSAFSDVKDSNSAYSYINVLNQLGYISGENGKFKPNDKITIEEVVKTVGKMLGYDVIAKSKTLSGEDSLSSYMQISEIKKIIKGINIQNGTQLVTMKDVLKVLYQALETPFNQLITVGDKVEYSNTDKEKCILKVYYGLTSYEGYVSDVNYDKNKIMIDVEGQSSKWYELNKDLSILNLLGSKQYFWINEDDVIDYYYPYEFSRIIYGYISSYNDEYTSGTVNTDNIDSLTMSGYSDSIPISSDFYVKQNNEVINGNVDLCGKFVRLEIIDNEIECLNLIGEPIEGGLTEYVSTNQITYKKGSSKLILEDELSGNVIILLNGKEVSYDKISANMYFDYISDSKYTYLLFSDKVGSGTLDGMEEGSIIVNNTKYDTTSKTIYVSTDKGTTYSSDKNYEGFLGCDVKVYTDMGGVVRYIIGVEAYSCYGIVLGGETKWDSDKNLYLGVIINGSMQKNVYTYSSKKTTVYYPEISYEQALLNKKQANGKGIYKFDIAGDKIRKIEAVEWKYADMLTTGESIDKSYNRIQSTDANNKYTYINPTSTVVFLYNKNGEFDPTVADFSQVKAGKTTGFTNFSFNVNNVQPMSDLLVFGANSQSIYDSTWYYGLVKNIKNVYKDNELYKKYEIVSPVGTQEFLIPFDKPLKVAGSDVEKFDVILYAYNGAFVNILQPLNTRKLSVLDENLVKYSHQTSGTSTDGTVTYTRDFFIAGVFMEEQNGFIRVMLNGVSTWYCKNKACNYISITNGDKVSSATVNDLIGKTVYMSADSGLIQSVITVER